MKEYEKHIISEGVFIQSSRVFSHCGKEINDIWSFQNVEHALLSIEDESRVVPCKKCIKEILKIFKKLEHKNNL